MSTLPAPRAPLYPKPPRRPPRPPLSHRYNPTLHELIIVDCDGVGETYRLVPLVPDFGRAAVELVITGSARFGTVHHCHRDDDGSASCTCPDYSFRGVCKHLTALCAEGLL